MSYDYLFQNIFFSTDKYKYKFGNACLAFSMSLRWRILVPPLFLVTCVFEKN